MIERLIQWNDGDKVKRDKYRIKYKEKENEQSTKLAKKVKKTDKLGKSLSLKCRYCGMPIGKELYDMDKPWEYTCKICGKQPYIELKELIDKNRNFKFDDNE